MRLGRTIVIGKSRSRQARTSASSQAILSREYCHQGFLSGVDSVMNGERGGFS